MTLEEERIRGIDAKALLDNRLLKEAFEKVGEHLEAKAMACDPNDEKRAANIITAKQILKGIKREIERVIEDGEVAEIRIDEMEPKKKGFKFLR